MPENPGFVDPYIDRSTGVLRNLVRARTQPELDEREADLVAQRRRELRRNPNLVNHSFDFVHLREVHRYLFQDVYDWAGQVRSVEISKSGTQFLPLSLFESAVPFIFREMDADEGLGSAHQDQFTRSLARHLDAVNHLHPFREGNGRAQRMFFDRIADRAGYRVIWRNIDPDENIDASRQGQSALFSMLSRIVEKKKP